MVWNVMPHFSPGRSGDERRQQTLSVPQERRGPHDRRGLNPPPDWINGWLCFESKAERRRLCPVPAGWEQFDENELEQCRCRASVTEPVDV